LLRQKKSLVINNNCKTKKMKNLVMNRKRFMGLIALMAAMVFAMSGCTKDDDSNGEGGDNGGGGGGVSGKRIKTVLDSSTHPPIGGPVKTEFTYNSNGTVKQTDSYDESNQRVMYSTFTYNSDGTRSGGETVYLAYVNSNIKFTYQYNSDKTPQKMEGTNYIDGVAMGTVTHEYTYQNGRKTRETQKIYVGATLAQSIQYDFNYDSNGRRTTVVMTPSAGISVTTTRTYNSDGTLQKITWPHYGASSPNATMTKTITWENGNSSANEDHYLTY
jgi:hypothetical protein